MSNYNWPLYNCIDAAVDFKIHDDVMKDVYEQGHDQQYFDTMALFPAIMYMQTNGFMLDQEALELEKRRISAETDKYQEELNQLVGHDLNVNSNPQCRNYFYGTLGFPPYTGKSGGVTTDDTAMSRLIRKGCREAGLVKTLRGLKKLKGTYLDVRVDPDGKLRSSFNPRGTITGRLSSSQTLFKTGLNFQNVDPRFKRFIKANPGRIFISLDKAQAEWVIMAYLCGDPKMISAIENGEDIHARTINEMTKVPLELIAEDSKLIGKLNEPDEILRLRTLELPDLINGKWNFLPKSMSLRQCGKKTNHGCNYMEGFRMFALLNELPENEAKLYVNGYRNTYIMLPRYWADMENQINRTRLVETCFGHKRRFLGRIDDGLIKAAVAHTPQSTSAWVVNHAMIKTYECRDPLFDDLQLHAQVHDELLLSYPINRWHDMAQVIYMIRDFLTPTLTYKCRDFTIGTDLAVGEYWAERDSECPRGITKVKINPDKNKFAEALEYSYKSAA